MSNTKSQREPANIRCAICGAPVAECDVPGMHGMIRDRAKAAADQLDEQRRVAYRHHRAEDGE